MCGRFTLTAPPAQIAELFELDEVPDLRPRFNVAPGQPVATVHQEREGRRVLRQRRWGLVPFWAEDARIGSRLINARSETAADKPAFREAFRRRRCLVPADGFYEWAGGVAGRKQPHHLRRSDQGLFAFAGLYERWRERGTSGSEVPWLETCTILTTDADATVAPLHDRMPVILAPSVWSVWLDPTRDDPAALEALLKAEPEALLKAEPEALPKAEPEALLEAHPVGLRVNRPEHDDAECLAPPEQGSLF